MGASLAVTMTLVNDKVQFTGSVRDHAPITVDYAPPLGDDQGCTSLELFLISLATCSATSIITLLRKTHKTVTGCTVHAHGTRRETHPTMLEHVTLEFTLQSDDVADADMQWAIRRSEETYCPVWAMVKGNVEVAAIYRILTTAGEEVSP